KGLPLVPEGASIILNAAIGASKGLGAGTVSSASKAAVRCFARIWTTDLKQRRIRVNAVSPGLIDTPGFNDALASAGAGREGLKAILTSVPLGRLGTSDEVARAVVFLASDDSSYITGTELFVDGGAAQEDDVNTVERLGNSVIALLRNIPAAALSMSSCGRLRPKSQLGSSFRMLVSRPDCALYLPASSSANLRIGFTARFLFRPYVVPWPLCGAYWRQHS